MTRQIKRIGLLTGGGDCPGLNAVIRAVTKCAIVDHGLEVVGIADGFLGLIEDRVGSLGMNDVSDILTRGGTILGANNRIDTTRYPVVEHGETVYRDVTGQAVARLHQHKIDALVVIGGDGTMWVANQFVQHGVNCIGVPKTIDNDLWGTDVTFGFASAVSVASDALDRIHTTAASHHRVMIVEVMGRNAGWIALHAGIASGADIILIPEIAFDVNAICEFIKQRERRGRRFTIICCSEGARPRDGEQTFELDHTRPDPVRLGGISRVIAPQIEKLTGDEARTTILGHVQRGGTPVPEDRVLGTRFGHAAVDALMRGRCNQLVAMQHNQMTAVDLQSIAGKQRIVPADHPLIEVAKAVGTSFGC